jgi:hypothetical protein
MFATTGVSTKEIMNRRGCTSVAMVVRDGYASAERVVSAREQSTRG